MDNKTNEEQNLIDLSALFRKMMIYLKKLWIFAAILALACGGLSALRSVRGYAPRYSSEAVFSVSVSRGGTDLSGYNYYYDNAAAKLVAETFPYILRSEVTLELLRQELGTDVMTSTISASSIADTNFFVLTVTSASAQDAYDTIRAVMLVYPQVSRQVVGETQLVISQEPELAVKPYTSLSWKSSAAKGALLGLLISAAVMLVLAIMHNTCASTDDVKKITSLECLARIPETGAKRRRTKAETPLIISRMEPDSAFCEAFRLLRLKLLRKTGGGGGKVIMFTSTLPSEGKTTAAANTAIAIARDGQKVLLIDGDLRGQSIKKLLGMTAPSAGLAECLGQSREKISFLRFEDTNLYVFAGDESCAEPTALLRHGRLERVFRLLRPMFDYIVVDTPPCAMMADAEVFSRHADKVVYVIREDFASAAQISGGIGALAESGADVCAYVFNRASAASRRSGYGYGYGYGYKYGKNYGYGYSKAKDKK